jgi:hypothetical protein
MKSIVLSGALALGALSLGSALASPRCNVPMANGQPRQALQEKVEAEGWKVTRTKTDDGYEIDATNEQGHRYEGKLTPARSKPSKWKSNISDVVEFATAEFLRFPS